MPVSKKVQASLKNSSWIRKMFEEGDSRKAKYGVENVFDFSLGNPNLEPPDAFKQLLRDLLDDPNPGKHGYMANAGYIETREAVAADLRARCGHSFSADDIVMTVGAGGGLNVIFRTLLNPGEEVIIPSPFFVEYQFYLENHQAVPRTVKTTSDFSLDLDAVEDAISEKTRAILMNSPNNPTGKVYTEEEIKALGKVLDDKSERFGQPIYLISDEPYCKIVYDGLTVPSVFDAYKESIVVTSFSKDLSLAGERIGYVAIHPDISDRAMTAAGMVFSNRILGFVNAPALMQRAVSGLLGECVNIFDYQKKRDLLCEGLASFGYEFVKPGGAFYLFPRT
ncbi:MAG: pyridoxal phosphate-dependent aminotransferase, partial [Deltaproteobacteria bacterium]|nr:pyridoxal phosphate-dependent aminotransferase [Deltaproteobacteria bacterium]